MRRGGVAVGGAGEKASRRDRRCRRCRPRNSSGEFRKSSAVPPTTAGIDEQIAAQQQRQAQLQTDRRLAQLRAQQEYAAQLARQQAQIRAQRDYARDAYVSAPHIYRYRMSGAYRETNQFGADLLRQSVNDGYRQGYRAG